MRNTLRNTQILNTVVIAIILSVALVSFDMCIMDATAEVAVTRADAADLAQMIEELKAEIKALKDVVLLLNDRLDEITKSAKAGQLVVADQKPAMRSPRQIDRVPVREEKTANLITQIKVLIEDEEMEQNCIDLLTTKKTGDFMESLKAQLTGWVETPTGDRSFATPFSPKQYAWVCYLLHPSQYPNPKTIKSLYP